MPILYLCRAICEPKRRVVYFVAYALRLSEDEEVDYHERIDEHEGYWFFVSRCLVS